MRKFPQPACFVIGLLVPLGCLLTFGKDTPVRGLDCCLPWRIARDGDQFVAVAPLKSSGLSAISTNGTDWQIQKIIAGFNAVTHGQRKFVAVGGSGAVGITTNGENWRIISITTNELCAVLYEDGCFVASGCAPIREFFTSRDGFIWKRHGLADAQQEARATAARFGKLLETAVTVPNNAAEHALTCIANEVRPLCRRNISGK